MKYSIKNLKLAIPPLLDPVKQIGEATVDLRLGPDFIVTRRDTGLSSALRMRPGHVSRSRAAAPTSSSVGCETKRSRPASFAAYMAWSAPSRTSSQVYSPTPSKQPWRSSRRLVRAIYER